MRAEGLFHRFHRKYVRTTDSDHDLPKPQIYLTGALKSLELMKLGAEILRISQQQKGGCIWPR